MVSGKRLDDLGSLAETLVALMATMSRSRAAMLQAAADDNVEWPAHVLLRSLKRQGPMRVTSVAECLHLDKSTVSRMVARLAGDGLLERRADPEDGRASILVPTEAGEGLVAEFEQRRLQFFNETIADWDDAEVAQLDQLLTRFAAAYDRAHDLWFSERQRRRDGHHSPERHEGDSA